ncbi:MAG: hypothetical protein QNK51_06770 [Chitinophagales bacterium]|tara:strand:- start:885 stop:1085 length:201 start_codon:yes stop_codon:yes gene_type:complete
MSQKMQIAFKWGLLGVVATAFIGLIFFVLTSLLNILLVGLLGSLLTSLVMRKEKPVELIIDEKLTN